MSSITDMISRHRGSLSVDLWAQAIKQLDQLTLARLLHVDALIQCLERTSRRHVLLQNGDETWQANLGVDISQAIKDLRAGKGNAKDNGLRRVDRYVCFIAETVGSEWRCLRNNSGAVHQCADDLVSLGALEKRKTSILKMPKFRVIDATYFAGMTSAVLSRNAASLASASASDIMASNISSDEKRTMLLVSAVKLIENVK